jgi:hypothetical protein
MTENEALVQKFLDAIETGDVEWTLQSDLGRWKYVGRLGTDRLGVLVPTQVGGPTLEVGTIEKREGYRPVETILGWRWASNAEELYQKIRENGIILFTRIQKQVQPLLDEQGEFPREALP